MEERLNRAHHHLRGFQNHSVQNGNSLDVIKLKFKQNWFSFRAFNAKRYAFVNAVYKFINGLIVSQTRPGLLMLYLEVRWRYGSENETDGSKRGGG